MPVITEKYEQYKIDKLRHFIAQMSEKGQPRSYEIYVDDLEVVSKTEDPKRFDDFPFYMTETTEKIRITIYNPGSGQSQYCYTIKPVKSENGLGEIESIIKEKLAERDREYELNRLKEELATTKEKLELLKQQMEDEKNSGRVKRRNTAEMVSFIAEAMIRRNIPLVRKIPVLGEPLAGILQQDNEEQAQRLNSSMESDAQASFKKKSSDNSAQLSQEELEQIAFIQQLFASFNQEDSQMIWQILTKLAEDPSLINTVADLLNIEKA